VKRAAVTLVGVLLLASAGHAAAAVHQATVGNYYFQDDATNDRAKLVVAKGDQVTFTVRAAASRPHSVNVDELGIHSGDLLLFETYTTPPLNRPGTFRLYCRNHERSNNHVASLVVKAPPTQPTTPATTPATSPPRTATTPRLVPSATAPSGASSTTVVQATTTPTGVRLAATTTTEVATVPAGRGTAPPGDRRRAAPAANSLEGLLGRHIGGSAPWTRAIRVSLAALVPVALVAGFALLRARERARGPTLDL
jgi:plastocyanin